MDKSALIQRTGGGTHELSVSYSSLQPSGNYPLQCTVSLPPLVSCCEGTIRWCIRITVTFEDCTVCHKVLAMNVARAFPTTLFSTSKTNRYATAYQNGPVFSAPCFLRQKDGHNLAVHALNNIPYKTAPATFIRAIQGANNFIISDSIRACQGSTISYTITAGIPGCNYPGISYTISVSGGVLISSSGNAFTIQWGSGASGMVSIHYLYNSPVGAVCDGFLFIQAILTPAPIASFTAAPNPACFQQPHNDQFQRVSQHRCRQLFLGILATAFRARAWPHRIIIPRPELTP
jgi:hypothetical protein